MPAMAPRRRLLALTLALPLAPWACSATPFPSVASLCGTWRNDAGEVERWALDGPDLRGEAQFGETRERLALVARARGRGGGHVYVAQPGDAAPTEFAPIDPSASRHGGPAPASATRWSWANYDHDFPQEIHYTLTGDRLEATIAGPDRGGAGGRSAGWTYDRVAACNEDEPR